MSPQRHGRHVYQNRQRQSQSNPGIVLRQNRFRFVAVTHRNISFQQKTKSTSHYDRDHETQQTEAKHACRNNEQFEGKRRWQQRGHQHRGHVVTIDQIFHALLFCFGEPAQSMCAGASRNEIENPATERGSSRRHERVEQHPTRMRSEEHTSELQSPCNLVCRLLLEKKKKNRTEAEKSNKKERQR